MKTTDVLVSVVVVGMLKAKLVDLKPDNVLVGMVVVVLVGVVVVVLVALVVVVLLGVVVVVVVMVLAFASGAVVLSLRCAASAFAPATPPPTIAPITIAMNRMIMTIPFLRR